MVKYEDKNALQVWVSDSVLKYIYMNSDRRFPALQMCTVFSLHSLPQHLNYDNQPDVFALFILLNPACISVYSSQKSFMFHVFYHNSLKANAF